MALKPAAALRCWSWPPAVEGGLARAEPTLLAHRRHLPHRRRLPHLAEVAHSQSEASRPRPQAAPPALPMHQRRRPIRRPRRQRLLQRHLLLQLWASARRRHPRRECRGCQKRRRALPWLCRAALRCVVSCRSWKLEVTGLGCCLEATGMSWRQKTTQRHQQQQQQQQQQQRSLAPGAAETPSWQIVAFR